MSTLIRRSSIALLGAALIAVPLSIQAAQAQPLTTVTASAPESHGALANHIYLVADQGATHAKSVPNFQDNFNVDY